MALREVVVMGIQLARACGDAHARGIVHRDIKPGNIMRLEVSTRVKVIRFALTSPPKRVPSTAGAVGR